MSAVVQGLGSRRWVINASAIEISFSPDALMSAVDGARQVLISTTPG